MTSLRPRGGVHVGDHNTKWRRWAGVPGVIAAVLPKAACPVCVAAYAGALSALGLGFLLTDRVLSPIIVVSLAVSVGSVGWNARRLHQPMPMYVAALGAVVVVCGRMVWSVPVAVYGGVVLLLGASLWTLWRKSPAAAPISIQNEGGEP